MTDLAELKRRCGGRIALKGPVDPIEVLLRQSPREVEAEVVRCIRALAPGGGYILGTADSTMLDTPFENIHAFVEAWATPRGLPAGGRMTSLCFCLRP